MTGCQGPGEDPPETRQRYGLRQRPPLGAHLMGHLPTVGRRTRLGITLSFWRVTYRKISPGIGYAYRLIGGDGEFAATQPPATTWAAPRGSRVGQTVWLWPRSQRPALPRRRVGASPTRWSATVRSTCS